MTPFLRLTVLMTLAAALFCGCANPYYTNSAAGGVGGAVFGTLSGAVAGNQLTRGLVGESMAAGAAIGLGGGMLSGALYTKVRRDMILTSNASTIQDNEAQIKQKRAQIEQLHEELMLDLDVMNFENTPTGRLYTGPTIGVYQ